jgi:archaellum biogenesis ATPase FlaH
LDFSSGLMSYQGKQVLTGAGDLFGKASKSIQKVITKLWYSRSETILMSRKLDKSNQLISVNSRLLDLKDKLNPNASTIQHLPQYYVSLFSGKSNIGKDFWVKRQTEEEAFKKALKRYKSGYGGGIMLLGDRNSGKTAFAKHITQALCKGKNIYDIFPPIAGTTSTAVFRDLFAKALQQRGDLRQMINRLPADSVIIINDLELFWERTEEGLEIIKKLEELIDELGKRVLFIVNMNPYAYRLINQMTRLGDRFIELIPLKPFSAEEIQTLILKRHKSSGLDFGYSEGAGQLNEVQMAALFNAYFNYSNGNPGTALNGWLGRIKKVSNGFIEVSKPDYPSLDTLKQLDAEWDMLLVQFILHKRLTEKKILQITQWTESKTKAVVLAMLRAGIIIEKSSLVYHLDTFIQPFVVDALKEKELLK